VSGASGSGGRGRMTGAGTSPWTHPLLEAASVTTTKRPRRACLPAHRATTSTSEHRTLCANLRAGWTATVARLGRGEAEDGEGVRGGSSCHRDLPPLPSSIGWPCLAWRSMTRMTCSAAALPWRGWGLKAGGART
jgi:hypothetical protein